LVPLETKRVELSKLMKLIGFENGLRVEITVLGGLTILTVPVDSPIAK
jgi:hypothetical protein